ncbi:MAG: YrdB family protein [Anaerolineales bacterium]|nr:YrdB family protein [Anaerolineales bacterium]
MKDQSGNQSLRFILEIFSLVVLGVWGWRQGEGMTGYLLGPGIPLAAAAVWWIFAVPGDPGRSGSALVPITGIFRLLLELALFALTVGVLLGLGAPASATILAAAVLVHYALARGRIRWLLRH